MEKSKHQEVEVQITPMLDMAFQLLTFFILTYHPVPVEGQFNMNLLPAAPVLDTNAQTAPSDAPANPELPAALRTMTTVLRAGPSGQLGKITIGEVEVIGLKELQAKVHEAKSDTNAPFDQALIRADPALRYEELIKVIDVFTQEKIDKISFAELDANSGAAL
jgi:biopolymer transport protein ExbD